jgi:hypothetical protein
MMKDDTGVTTHTPREFIKIPLRYLPMELIAKLEEINNTKKLLRDLEDDFYTTIFHRLEG